MPGRLLRLLSLLQSRGQWSAAELSERLGIQPRTLRRDIYRLIALDYPIRSRTGRFGGYSLGESTHLPPLQFDDDEAVAVALALAASGGSIHPALASARIKLERLLPARLRRRYHRLAKSIDYALPHDGRPGNAEEPATEMLVELSDACADRISISFIYDKRDGGRSVRRVLPHRLVALARRWYLVAHDSERDDWRIFRVERMSGLKRGHETFAPLDLDAVDHVRRSFAQARYRWTATLTFALSKEQLQSTYFGPIFGEVVDLPNGFCRVTLSADSIDLLMQTLGGLLAIEAAVDIEADAEVLERVERMRVRMAR